MLDFFDEPGDSERRTQAGDLYLLLYTDNDKSLQIILLDLRWNGTALTEIADPVVLEEREAQQRGPYEVLGCRCEIIGRVSMAVVGRTNAGASGCQNYRIKYSAVGRIYRLGNLG
ncbi:MAG: hypothetical protein CM1200mP40_31300 [Gammaproteobacteria bacterium]|nr:MAG: hypothetical protein CM1200mP40_31300 [Gammaproteobacteria bacterium]